MLSQRNHLNAHVILSFWVVNELTLLATIYESVNRYCLTLNGYYDDVLVRNIQSSRCRIKTVFLTLFVVSLQFGVDIQVSSCGLQWFAKLLSNTKYHVYISDQQYIKYVSYNISNMTESKVHLQKDRLYS